MTGFQISAERPFLIPAAHDLYLRVLRGELTNPPESPELGQLLDVHLLAPDPDRAGHYRALDVGRALRTWQGGLHTMASNLLLEAQTVEAQLQPLATAWNQAQAGKASAPGVEVVHGYDEIDRRLGPIIASCRVEAMTAHPTGPRSPKVLARSYERDMPLLRRGATMRTIYLPAVRGDAPTARWAQTMTEQGVQIRTSTDFCRVIIIDYHTVITSVLRREDQITEPEPNDAAMIITHPALVAHWMAGFERDWARAEPWSGTLTKPAPKLPLTPTDVQILDCLAQGMDQDEAAAAHHVSRRYVTGKLAALRAATGVKSHGQLMFWWGKHYGDYKKERRKRR
jgi:DNA-binding CsgD family transcriptional regulator